MSLDEAALEAVANGGSMDLEKWAGMVAPLLERLEHIVHNVFPMPKVPRGSRGQQPFQPQPKTNDVPPESSNKENAAPGDPQSPSPAAPNSQSTERIPDLQPQSAPQTSDSLPPPLALLVKNIRSAIESFFTEKPPHTIQRFAELILRPTAHYRTLPAYLRAVDRVISVTSGADVFPFNAAATTIPQSNGFVHPANSAGIYLTSDHAHGLGSDESLGGALLTPIPWLTNVSLEGEDGNVLEGEETGPTQAQEAPPTEGVGAGTSESEADGAASTASPGESADEVPHARGPPVVGVEDLGLQDGKGVEMTLAEQETQGSIGDGGADVSVSAVEPSSAEGSGSADKDGDIVLEDSKPKEDPKPDEEKSQSSQALDTEKKE
ncbi:hypothetical protein N7512_002552 [Penicillium capsulatum]|nr:hypothetical protein N7512_002552 [Penicillium capsulatum]